MHAYDFILVLLSFVYAAAITHILSTAGELIIASKRYRNRGALHQNAVGAGRRSRDTNPGLALVLRETSIRVVGINHGSLCDCFGGHPGHEMRRALSRLRPRLVLQVALAGAMK